MTLRAVIFGLILGTVLVAARVVADGYWGHRITVRTDVAYGTDPAQALDAYLQGTPQGEPTWFSLSGRKPTLVWIHGGGWLRGDKGAQLPWIAHFLERGYNAVSLNYRQGADTAPQAIDDVMCAYKWLTEEAVDMGVDPANMVVAGASAGGHLALMLGVLNTSGEHPCRAKTPPKAVVNWFGITDIKAVEAYLRQERPQRNYAREWVGTPQHLTEIANRYSPLLLVDDDTPPIITIHGTSDTVVPFNQAEALHQTLTSHNRLIALSGGNHGGFTDAQFETAYQAIFAFLDDL